MKVLVVEDEESVRFLLGRQLSDLGAELVFAHDLPAAIDEMKKVPPPDFIILDLGLPGSPSPAGTLEQVPMLSSFNPNAPIMVLTGSEDEKLQQLAAGLGAASFSRKRDVAGQIELWTAIKTTIDAKDAPELAALRERLNVLLRLT